MIELDEIRLSPHHETIYTWKKPVRDKDAFRITLEPFKNTNLIKVYYKDGTITNYYSNVFIAKEKIN